jgi:peptide/nickel transport system permease protein
MTVEQSYVLDESLAPPRRRAGALWAWLRLLVRFCRRKPLGAVGGLLILTMIAAAALAPLVPADPLAQNAAQRLKPPSARHWFGTDEAGRDIFSRVVWGSRTSLQVGVIAVAVGTAGGTLIGLLTGYVGGRVDMVVQRLMDSLMAFPALVLAMIIAAMFGRNISLVMVAIGIVLIPGTNRVVRGAVLGIKPNPFVEAARVLGASDARVLALHVFPNVLPSILILATAALGNAILIESSLSFVGLGTPPPQPSWGRMLSGAGRLYFETAPWMAVAPGMAITLGVLGFNLLGDALRDVWDPRLRGAR